MSDVQAAFFATLVDEWSRSGVTDAVVAPGHRSTILAATLLRDGRIRVHVMVDERSAAFFALGLGLATGRPAVFWCTSGTAAAEAHAAVIEADAARVPLLVCTADRPAELHHVRDWQSIDQTSLFGDCTRWSYSPGVADAAMSGSWRSIAARSVSDTVSHPCGAGPVHLNLAIREPWALDPGSLPESRTQQNRWHATHAGTLTPPPTVVNALTEQPLRGLFVAGRGEIDVDLLHSTAEALGWPVLAEARSDARVPRRTTVAASHELLAGAEFARDHVPDVVVRLGTPVLSKRVAAWLHGARVTEWSVGRVNAWDGPALDVEHMVQADTDAFMMALRANAPTNPPSGWVEAWHEAEKRAQEAIERTFAAEKAVSESAAVRALVDSLPVDTNVFAATSMPVRSLEWYSKPRAGVTFFANRGVSGMDGVTSSAAGVACGTGRPTLLLIGDLTLLHDLNALWTLRGASGDVPLTIVVFDNDGGGIFSNFENLRALGDDVFERVVATPQHVDITAAASALDIASIDVDTIDDLIAEVQASMSAGGIRLVRIATNRHDAVGLSKRLSEAVSAALQ